ncbi:MAG TPA: hypothetical protein DDY41_13720 [Arthrobacter bacterium]|nr:hypothetical protein [Arthrobacter sp.]
MPPARRPWPGVWVPEPFVVPAPDPVPAPAPPAPWKLPKLVLDPRVPASICFWMAEPPNNPPTTSSTHTRTFVERPGV